MPRAFIGLFAVSLFTDSIDGFLARRLHEESVWGARLDSWGDFAIVSVLPVSALLLWPQMVVRELPFIAVGVVCYFLPTIVGVLKYGRPTSYHTYGAKLSAVAVGLSLLVLFSRISPWPFRLCAPLLVLEALEELAMTCVLKRWHANVPTLWHALKLRRAGEAVADA
jgi:CDP-diacylglycerol--glycerol-3-phosphate 3-phosphatidyltransferase